MNILQCRLALQQLQAGHMNLYRHLFSDDEFNLMMSHPTIWALGGITGIASISIDSLSSNGNQEPSEEPDSTDNDPE